MSTITASVRYTEGFLRNRRSRQLFYCGFFPSQVRVKGVVLFLHGINEHSHRFVHVYERLLALGFAVIAYDMIGHGRSDCDVDCEGIRAHADVFEHFVQDTNDVLTAAKYSIYKEMLAENEPEPPLYFMGMSYGCLVGLHTILTGEHHFSGVILAAPALGVNMTPVLRLLSLLSAPLVAAFPRARIIPADFDAICRDKQFVEECLADPLNVVENLTARMGANSLAAMQQLSENTAITDRQSAFCQLPLLMVQGTGDIITSVPVAQAFYDRIANFDKELKLYDGLYHCVFNEPEKDQVLDDVCNWLVAHADLHAAITVSQKPIQATQPFARL
ncbi:hypothetical protein Poli38472_010704 [Pythium oligandrum]|uniref:Serine aminopeptidase S33 domain-containing protein n=1 Tax=Pythium oligandrum TaxID=41045 RepID=A0A8K1CDY0_PYTOL|nr:hypothetical protein Poli38472_010704 [Pythium oligandrum]|eukprot:TMW61641.1 hypothetical protein Poli38472_010704 [Pythium oligandrum]